MSLFRKKPVMDNHELEDVPQNTQAWEFTTVIAFRHGKTAYLYNRGFTSLEVAAEVQNKFTATIQEALSHDAICMLEPNMGVYGKDIQWFIVNSPEITKP